MPIRFRKLTKNILSANDMKYNQYNYNKFNPENLSLKYLKWIYCHENILYYRIFSIPTHFEKAIN